VERYPLTQVPSWCLMSPVDHQDNLGGCWGISHGLVAKEGREYCKGCGYYMSAETELERLKEAIRTSGYAVLKASNGWSIHDVSEREKALAERELETVNDNIHMGVAIKQALAFIGHSPSDDMAKLRNILSEPEKIRARALARKERRSREKEKERS